MDFVSASVLFLGPAILGSAVAFVASWRLGAALAAVVSLTILGTILANGTPDLGRAGMVLALATIGSVHAATVCAGLLWARSRQSHQDI